MDESHINPFSNSEIDRATGFRLFGWSESMKTTKQKERKLKTARNLELTYVSLFFVWNICKQLVLIASFISSQFFVFTRYYHPVLAYFYSFLVETM